MNADLGRQSLEIEPFRLSLPEAALARLRLRLGQGLTNGEVLEASCAYGVPWAQLRVLVEHWCYGFEPERQPLFDLPFFEANPGGARLSFVHARSARAAALPLLLLPGYAGSVAEVQHLIEPLTNPGLGVGGAFHVVCPALPGFGLSDGAPCPRMAAKACATLMQRLGYARYLVHGSDIGANVALELGALDTEHVAALHVTALPAYPSDEPREVASLSREEKSQLARLSELNHELCFQLPESPIQDLAFAMTQLDDAISHSQRLYDTLLAGVTLSWTLGDAATRSELYRHRLRSAPTSRVPLALAGFPLDAPNLRRFAERNHRVVEWREHEHGGGMPAIEQPELLLESLRGFFERLR